MSIQLVEVLIAGRKHRIRTDLEEESLREIALYVDQTMQHVRDETGTVDSLDIAVLSCVKLSREIHSLKGEESDGASDASLRSLIDRVEAVCSSPQTAKDAGDTSESSAASDGARQASDSSKSSSNKQQPQTSASDAAPESAKSLDLPSIEKLRERAGSAPDDADEDEAEMPEARVASGGRDRAS